MSKESNAIKLVKIHAGHVIIRNGRKEYNDNLSGFESDNGAPMPPLSAGFIGESYAPGEWHRITTGSKAIQLEMPWAEGEALLGKLDALLTAQEARIAIPDPDPDPTLNVRRLAALESVLTRLSLDPNASQEEKDYQANRPDS